MGIAYSNHIGFAIGAWCFIRASILEKCHVSDTNSPNARTINATTPISWPPSV